MLTGVYPALHGVLDQNKLRSGVGTIAEMMRGKGYHTGGFVNNSQVGALVGLDRGHDDFFEIWKGYARNQLGGRVLNRARAALGYNDHGAARTNKLVLDWLRQREGEQSPFYLFIHYIDAHNPLQAPRPFAGKFLKPELMRGLDKEKIRRVADNPLVCVTDNLQLKEQEIAALTALYDEEIAYVDSRLGELLSHLESTGLAENTVIAVTADHGEHLGEGQRYSHVASLSQPIVHIPLLLRMPGGDKGGLVCTEPVQHIDLLPTFARACGLDDVDLDAFPGRSLLDDEGEGGERFLLAEWEGRIPYFVRDRLARRQDDVRPTLKMLSRKLWMCRRGNFKLIEDDSGSAELFDLESDRAEERNLAGEKPDLLKELQAELGVYRSTRAEEGAEAYDYSEKAIKDHLKALGYL